jgi:hypothetical protein
VQSEEKLLHQCVSYKNMLKYYLKDIPNVDPETKSHEINLH